MINFLRYNYLLLVCLILLCLLLFKDIFSERTLIPNIEPYPDTIHYIGAVRSFVRGDGLNIIREGRAFIPSVPPLYSLSLVPVYAVSSDPRMFYFTNVLLAIVSLFIFYRILIRLVGSSIIRGFVLFLYVTNYDLYWFPNLAMAENLILLLFLLFVFLLISKASLFNIFSAGILTISFYATKYASMPLTGSFFIAYLVKLFFLWRSRELRISGFLLFFSSTFLAFTAFSISEYLTKGIIPLSFLMSFSSSLGSQAAAETNVSPWFSFAYMNVNVGHYLSALTGGSERFLWDFTPLVPRFVAVGGILGLLGGILTKQFRLVSITLLLALVSSVLFMSTFYAVDMRYIYTAIPTLLLGFGGLLQILENKIEKPDYRKFFYFLVLLLATFYILTSAERIKYQIMLNLKHAETPWYYVSILELNKYFKADEQSSSSKKIKDGKKPVVISPMPPYYIDFFSNGNYLLLPLSKDQEFRGTKEAAWGPNDYSNLIRLYVSYLNNGHSLYVANYGLGNEGYLHEDFNTLKSNFKLIQVSSGCYNACNIYKVEIKDEE